MNIIKRCRYGLMIYNSRDIWQGRSFDRYGEYSESEVQLFRRLVQPGGAVIDIGANIGSHTLAFIRIVGPGGFVVAFEPESNAFYALCGNMAINNVHNVFCFQQAVGRETGIITVPLLDLEKTVNFGGLQLNKDYSGGPNYQVVLNKLDAISVERCDLIKIDIEGMEVDALEGGREFINKFRPYLYVENNDKERLQAYMQSMNYKTYQHQAPFFNPDNFYEEKQDVFRDANGVYVVSDNLLGVPAEKQCPINEDELRSLCPEPQPSQRPPVVLS